MFHLSVHGRQVPDAADNGPTAHHPQEVTHQAKLTAVPESIPEARIVLQGGHRAVLRVGKQTSTMRRKEERGKVPTLMATG